MKIIILGIVLLFTSGCFIVNYPELSQEKSRLEREQSFRRGHYQDQIERLRNQVVQLNTQLADKVTELEAERGEYERKKTGLSEELELIEREYEGLVEELEAERDRYKRDYEELIEERDEMEEKLAELREELETAESELLAQKEETEYYKEELDKFATDYDDIYEEFHNTIDEYEKLVEENEELLDKIHSLEQQLEDKETQLTEARDDIREEPELQFNLDAPADRLKEELTALSNDINVTQTPYSIRILVPGEKLFAVGTAQIESRSHSTLNEVASLLKNYEDEFYLFVEGHTDALPVVDAPFPSNWELSATRATNLVRYFIRETALEPESLIALACSSYRPISDVLEENRRIEIVLIPRELYVFN